MNSSKCLIIEQISRLIDLNHQFFQLMFISKNREKQQLRRLAMIKFQLNLINRLNISKLNQLLVHSKIWIGFFIKRYWKWQFLIYKLLSLSTSKSEWNHYFFNEKDENFDELIYNVWETVVVRLKDDRNTFSKDVQSQSI